MKTYLSDLIPRIKRFSQELDNITLLTNQHWVVIDELSNSKYVYIFRSNSELLIAQDGKVEKGKWEYLGNNAILIERKEGSYLFRHGFFDENVLALKVDGKEEYAFLINENRYSGELDSIEKIFSFLEGKYLKIILPPLKQQEIESPIDEEKNAILSYHQKEIHNMVFEKINPLLVKLSELVNDNVLTQDDFDQKKKELIDKYSKKFQEELFNKCKNEMILFEKKCKQDLLGVEMMGVTKLEAKLNEGDLILKSKKTKIIGIYTPNEIEQIRLNGEVGNYFLIEL